MFVIPKRREVVRVSGTAQVVKDSDLLKSMTVNGKSPDLALLVRVEEAMFHCGKAMIRSGMWEPERWGSIDGLPTYAEALIDHGKLKISHDAMHEGVVKNEVERLY